MRPPYEADVFVELSDLTRKIGRLQVFTESDPRFFALDMVDRSNLKSQLFFMEKYRDVLEKRVKRFGGRNPQ